MYQFHKTFERYTSICKKYGVDVRIARICANAEKYKIDGNLIGINTDIIPENELEDYLSFCVRRKVLPELIARHIGEKVTPVRL